MHVNFFRQESKESRMCVCVCVCLCLCDIILKSIEEFFRVLKGVKRGPKERA